VTDEAFAADAKAVEDDLRALKRLLEAGGEGRQVPSG
jgi:hypothetical protein